MNESFNTELLEKELIELLQRHNATIDGNFNYGIDYFSLDENWINPIEIERSNGKVLNEGYCLKIYCA